MSWDESIGVEGVIDVGGAELRYCIEGDGATCLVMGSRDVYRRVFSPELRRHLRLVFVDLRHFGLVDPTYPVDQITVETYPDDIERVREVLELGDVILVGHSMHAVNALEYASAYPARVRGVVAIGASSREDDAVTAAFWEADASPDRTQHLARNLAALAEDDDRGWTPSQRFVRQYVASGPQLWRDPTYDASWIWDGVEVNRPTWDRNEALFDWSTYDMSQVAGQLPMPVLVIAGRYDYVNPSIFWEQDQHHLKREDIYVLFENSGHQPYLEETERFGQVMLTWTEKLSRPLLPLETNDVVPNAPWQRHERASRSRGFRVEE